MERRYPRDEEKINQDGLSPDDDEGVRFAAAVRRILAAGAIPQRELDEDHFLGDESIAEHVRRQMEKP
jgi:hypothetical protein